MQCRRVGTWRRVWTVVAVALPALSLMVMRARAKPENIHRQDADCTRCHTVDRATLEADPVEARTRLVDDVDTRCNECHGDEGPSHRVGMPPTKPLPDTLPLASNGNIACATCHFVHGEHNSFRDFVRIDNARGGLCLTCHELAELESGG